MTYVLVTTEFRGVFAGEQGEYDKQERRVVLKNARCAIYWGTSGGFLELAQEGPNQNSRIGTVAPEIELHSVTSVTKCSDKARKAWESR